MKNFYKSSLLDRIRNTALAATATLMALPVNAATTSFPQYPLLTGGSSLPPNILLILDDSGSMEYPWMPAYSSLPADKTSLGDNVTDRSYYNNSIYYNPNRTYQPWRTASTNLNDRFGNADFRNAASSTTSPVPSTNDQDLRDTVNSYFYVPKSGVSNPGTTSGNYDKYRIATSSSTNNFNNGVVQVLTSSNINSTLVGPVVISSISTGSYSSCVSVATNASDSVKISTSGGTGDGDLYVYSNANCSGGTYNTSTGNNNTESVTYTTTPPDTISFRVKAYAAVSNITYTVTGTSKWQDATPTGRSQADELQNFANWYQYHRTRNKMAKAGASEAFGKLGKNYRVGFDTIWNKGGSTSNTSGSTPAYPIPVSVDNGLFEDSGTTIKNRTNFYAKLQAAGADNNTPLKGALQRAARYFKTDDPWKDSGGMLTCRQNYAILTTDGYWNNDSGYSPAVGNADNVSNWAYRDNYSDTLADVAYKYWSTDLRTDMADNVRTSASDSANWQHMVTFGVSIGQQGTLDQSQPPPSPWSVNPTSGGEGPKRIDDLWHAAINGHGSFVVATDTDKFASALSSALATIDARSASGSNIASSSTKTDTSTLTFVAGFTSSTWLGDLITSPFNAALTGVSSTALWTLSKTFAASGANQSFKTRTVLTSKGGTPAFFNASVSGASDFAARTGQADEASAADNIAYLLGDQSKEIGKTNGTLRARAWPIGDIVDSSPAYVEDTKTVYVGANDGMLHGIDTSNGKVLFSYVPKGLDFSAMASLSSTSYDHRYFVDGQIDVISKANQGNGKNILVAALGRGGRGVFALDVTNPSSMGTANVLWDNTTQDATADKDMGYVLGQIRIRKGNGGKTYALVPNGTDSQNGSATLYVYQLDADGKIATTTKLVADSAGGNGLMSLGMADLNGDGTIDTVYGGDLKGNVWRWDFSGNNPPAAAVKLFQATDGSTPQPITGGIGVGRDDNGNIFVGFGTGKFIASSDLPGNAGYVTQTQSIYGIIDKGTTVTRAQLQARTIPFSGTNALGQPVRGFENYSALPAAKQGWYINLTSKEEVISAPTVYGSAMFLASVIPASGSDCSGATGSGFINAVDLYTGTSPGSGGYFTDGTVVKDANGNSGVIGSIGISGGMPTEVNLTNSLATVGTGAFSSDGAGNTSSTGINTPNGGKPSRVNWREIVSSN